MDSGQKCAVASCEAKGSPSREIPGSAWCYGHAQLPHKQKVAIWQAAVLKQEERERAAP